MLSLTDTDNAIKLPNSCTCYKTDQALFQPHLTLFSSSPNASFLRNNEKQTFQEKHHATLIPAFPPADRLCSSLSQAVLTRTTKETKQLHISGNGSSQKNLTLQQEQK